MHNATRPRLSFFPSAPIGASVFARYVIYHILSGSPSVSVTKANLFGESQKYAIDPFGASLIKVAEVAPWDAFQFEWLLERATLFGFYSIFLSPQRKLAWYANQLAGQSKTVNAFLRGSTKFHRTKPELHFCDKCIANDEKQYGIAYWRLLHQIPGVHHCRAHDTNLSGSCKQCRRPIATEKLWYPPSINCPYCGGRSFEQSTPVNSPAYFRFVELCEAAVNGTISPPLMAQRHALYSGLRCFKGGPTLNQVDVSSFADLILEPWLLKSIEQLESYLSTSMGYRFLGNALLDTDHGDNPVGHLAIMAAIDVRGAVVRPPSEELNVAEKPAELFSNICLEVLRKKHLDPTRVSEALEKMAFAHGLPRQAGAMLAEGVSKQSTFRKLGIPGTRGTRFSKALDMLDLRTGATIDILPQSGRRPRVTVGKVADAVRKLALREKHRNTLLRVANGNPPTRVRLHELAKASYVWCVANDKLWFEKIISPLIDNAKRHGYRSRLLALVEKGCGSQSSLRRHDLQAYHWCLRYDRPWLDELLPSIQRSKRLSPDEMLAQCKAAVTDAVSSGARIRQQIPGFAVRFLRKSDPTWLDRTLPKAVPRPTFCKTSLEQFREKCRGVINVAIAEGAVYRNQLPGFAMRFCRDYDAMWLQSRLPGRRPVRNVGRTGMT